MTTAGPVVPDHVPGPVARWRVAARPTVAGAPVTLAVATVGPIDAPAVVLAHGVGSSARWVASVCAAPLVEAGFRLVAYDARGHGASSAAPDVADHHLDVHAADLDAVVASIDGEVAAVGGVSLGAHAAVRATSRHPRVVCLPAWIGTATAGDGPHAAVAAEVRAIGIGEVVARLAADTAMPAWLRDTLVTDYRRHDAASLTAALLALDGADAPTRDELAGLDVPVAVVGWPDDPGHPLEVARTWANLAGGTLTTLRLEDLDVGPTRFGDAVVTALRSIRGP